MNARGILYKSTDLLRSVIAPQLQYSQHIYEEELSKEVTTESRWLDLGCGHQLLPEWRADSEYALVRRCDSLVGLDFVFQSVRAHRNLTDRVQGDISALPFAPDAFNLITANMVVEHLATPEKQFDEIFSVLAPGGCFMFHTPSVRGYANMLARLAPESIKAPLAYLLEGRTSGDVFPTHYQCNSVDVVRQLAAKSGFAEPEFRMVVSVPVTAMIPPLAAFELVFIRALMTTPLRRFRTSMIVRLRKPGRTQCK